MSQQPEASTEAHPSDSTGRTVAFDEPTQMFYKGVAAAGRVIEAHESTDFPDFETRLSLFWFYVGALSAEDGAHNGDYLPQYMQGVATRAPQRGQTQTDEVDEIAQHEAGVTSAVLEEHPDALTWALNTTEWDNGYFFSDFDVTVTLGNGTLVEGFDASAVTDDITELSDLLGPLGAMSTHSHTITDEERAAHLKGEG